MTHPVPDGLPVALRALPIAIWHSDYVPAPADTKKVEHGQIAFAPVEGAFVACIRIGNDGETLPSASWQLRCGRTNDFGWVLLRERGALGAEGETPRSGWRVKALPAGGAHAPEGARRDGGVEEYEGSSTDARDAGVYGPYELASFYQDDERDEHDPPPELASFGPEDAAMFELDGADANADAMFVLPNQRILLFWTYDAELFDGFLRTYDAGPTRAVALFMVESYVVEPFAPKKAVYEMRELRASERAFVARCVQPEGEGYHGGWPSLDGMSAAIFDGTSHALRTLYLCEWLHDTCVAMVRGDPHWPYLLALRSMIKAAEDGAPIFDLAKRMPKEELGMAAQNMRVYLHALASVGMDSRKIATELLDVTGESRLQAHWKVVARSIADNPRYSHLEHPALRAPSVEPFRFTPDERAALLAYFDMYVEGFRYRDDAQAIEAHWEHVQQASGWVQTRQAELLRSVGHVRFMRCVGLHLPTDARERRAELSNRYNYLSAVHQVRFWEAADLSLNTTDAWDAHKPFIAWMGDGTTWMEKAFDSFLLRYLPAYRNLIGDSLEQAVQYLYRHHLVLNGKAIQTTLPQHSVVIRLEPDLTRSLVIAKALQGGSTTVLAELTLLTSVKTVPAAQVHAPVGGSQAGARFQRYRRALQQGKVRTFQAVQTTLLVPDKDQVALESFPKRLAEAAAALKLAAAVTYLVVAMKKKDAEVNAELYWNLGQETLGALGPATQLAAPLLARMSPVGKKLGRNLVHGAEMLGRVGLASEAVRGILTGGATLLTFFGKGDDTDLARYFDEGKSLPALLETVKGVLQIADGGLGVAGVVLGTGTTLAAVPIATWLAIGMLAVSTIDVLIYVDDGGPSPIQDFLNSVGVARKAQFIIRERRITMPGDVHKDQNGKTRRCSNALAQRLGMLNEALKA